MSYAAYTVEQANAMERVCEAADMWERLSPALGASDSHIDAAATELESAVRAWRATLVE